MTTTAEVAVIEDTEVEEVAPLTKTKAKSLDKKIRSAADKVARSHEKTLGLFDELGALLTQAQAGEIHKALGLKSWTAYIADSLNIDVPQREDRKAVVSFLSGQGLSQRAIAAMTGVSQKTIDRDLEGEDDDDDENATVTSLDGAKRPKKGKKSEPEVIDAEVVEEDGELESVPLTAAEIVVSFAEETAALVASSGELKLLAEEDKWAGARKRITKANLNDIGEVITELQAIVDDLMEN
jgi:transposase